MVKNTPANARNSRDAGSTPGSGRSPAGGNGKPLQYSCLGNPMDRGAWWATVHGVAKSQTRLSTHYPTIPSISTWTQKKKCIIHLQSLKKDKILGVNSNKTYLKTTKH